MFSRNIYFCMETLNKILLWEDENLTEQLKKLENNPILVPNDTTNETKNESVKNEWRIIGGIKKWVRNCPKCGQLQTYSREDGLISAIKLNRVCLRCYHNNRIIQGEWKRSCPNCNKEIQYTTKSGWRKAIKGSNLCKNCSGIEIEKHLNGWVRKCPRCNKDIIYKNHKGVWIGNKKNSLCKKCHQKSTRTYLYSYGFTRNCPDCGKELKYAKKENCRNAVKKTVDVLHVHLDIPCL